jgi:hypothetical protein
MSKKEKYYNYVVNDLVSKTEIDNDQEKIKFPFLLLHPFPFFYYHPHFPLSTYLFPSFIKYVKTRYGAHDGEIKIIWNLYKERIHSLIK